MQIVFLNGEYIPINEARVSVLDRGFLFADSIYEVISVFNNELFRADEHLARLERSLKAIDLNFHIDREKLKNIFQTLIKKNSKNGKNQTIYLQITRGPMPARSHTFPDITEPTVFIQATPLKTLSHDELRKGFSAITTADERRYNCYIKSTSLLPNMLAMQRAKQVGALEAILIRDGKAVECASSNLFIVKNNTIQTPPLTPYMLGGITRELIIELAQKNNLPLTEKTLSTEELFDADEVWVTGSTKEICPIIKIDNKTIADGNAGPVWQTMLNLYESSKL